MRYGPDDEFWIVLDPTPENEMVDILFTTSLRTLRLQFLGGLSMEQNPTIFTDEREATVEAERRLTSLRGVQAGPRPETPSGAGPGRP